SNSGRQCDRVATKSQLAPAACHAAPPARVLRALLLRLLGVSCVSSSCETDDLRPRNRIGRKATFWTYRRTTHFPPFPALDELIEVCISEPHAWPLLPASNIDVAQLAIVHELGQLIGRYFEPSRCLLARSQFGHCSCPLPLHLRRRRLDEIGRSPLRPSAFGLEPGRRQRAILLDGVAQAFVCR